MLMMSSKALSAGQARVYHAREFAAEQANYWSRDQQGFSEWQGRLAEQWGLSGPVGNDHFARLSKGQHPLTEEQLVRHQVSRTYDGKAAGKSRAWSTAPMGCDVPRTEIGFVDCACR